MFDLRRFGASLVHRSRAPQPARATVFLALRDDNLTPAAQDDPRLGGLLLDPPYQRGDVWSTAERVRLMQSFMLGDPVPAIITNNRTGATKDDPEDQRDFRLAIIDGRQRVTTLLRWFDHELAIPA